MHAALPRPLRSTGTLVALGTGAVALLTLAAAQRFGLKALLLPVVLTVGALLLRLPELALGVALFGAALFEEDELSFMPGSGYYDAVLPALAPFDALLYGAAAVIAVECLRRSRSPVVPRPLIAVLALLLAALGCGLVTGLAAGAGFSALYGTALGLIYLVIVPLAVLALVDDAPRVRRLLAVALGLAVFKAVSGITAVFAGVGNADEKGTHFTYYDPTANWMIVLALLWVVAAFVRRARLPAWAPWLFPLMLAAVVLSYRRSFWLLTVMAIVLVLIFGVSRLGRRLAVPTVAVLAAGVWLLFSAGLSTGLQGPVVERAKSLDPTKVEVNAQDRYRIDERRNVIAEVRGSPLAGLGIGVPWAARYPLPIDGAGGRQYTHTVVLWYWMKLGILGPIAYLAFMLTAAWMGLRVSRKHPDPRLAAFGMASFAAILSMMVAEGTASFTGVDARFSVAMGTLMGVLSVLYLQSVRRSPDAAAP